MESKFIVLEALHSLHNRKELQVDSSRTSNVKKFCVEVQGKVSSDDSENHHVFVNFSDSLLSLLRTPLCLDTPAAMPKRREHMWVEYARLRAEDLPGLWKKFLTDIKSSHVASEPLFMEIVNEAIFEKLIEETFKTEPESHSQVVATSLTKDEENILRYACGYVGMKLHQRFLKTPGEKAAQFVECLSNMHSDGPTSSLLDYTKEWVEKVNRGGLFDISDEAYRLFLSIEMSMRNILTEHLKKQRVTEDSSEGKSAIIEFVIKNDDVQFYWSMLSIDVEEEHNSELLQHIVQLWLTIRGFSISKAWMENYKCAAKSGVSKSKSLRKNLKRKAKTPPQE